MRFYLDTSVLTVYLFGRDREPNRYPHTVRLFDEINAGRADGLVSLYALQEIFAFCQDNFPEGDVEEVAALAFRLHARRLDRASVKTSPTPFPSLSPWERGWRIATSWER